MSCPPLPKRPPTAWAPRCGDDPNPLCRRSARRPFRDSPAHMNVSASPTAAPPPSTHTPHAVLADLVAASATCAHAPIGQRAPGVWAAGWRLPVAELDMWTFPNQVSVSLVGPSGRPIEGTRRRLLKAQRIILTSPSAVTSAAKRPGISSRCAAQKAARRRSERVSVPPCSRSILSIARNPTTDSWVCHKRRRRSCRSAPDGSSLSGEMHEEVHRARVTGRTRPAEPEG
jgi:hypothetical protein